MWLGACWSLVLVVLFGVKVPPRHRELFKKKGGTFRVKCAILAGGDRSPDVAAKELVSAHVARSVWELGYGGAFWD